MSSVAETPVRLTALHYKHLALKATMFSDNGWIRPAHYQFPEEEVARVLKAAAVCDTSPFRKIDVKGPDTDAFLQEMLSPDLAPKRAGEVKVAATFEASARTAQTDFLAGNVQYVCRLGHDHALLVASANVASSHDVQTDSSIQGFSGRAYVTDVTSALAGLNVAGPTSPEVLAKLTQLHLALDVFTNPGCAEAGLAKIHSILVRADARHTSGRVTSYDVYFGRAYAEYVWDAIMDAGRESEIVPFGVAAHRLLHESAERRVDLGIVTSARR